MTTRDGVLADGSEVKPSFDLEGKRKQHTAKHVLNSREQTVGIGLRTTLLLYRICVLRSAPSLISIGIGYHCEQAANQHFPSIIYYSPFSSLPSLDQALFADCDRCLENDCCRKRPFLSSLSCATLTLAG